MRFDKMMPLSQNAPMLPLRPSEVKRVLIVRMSALGDVIHNLPALSALRSLYPNAEIDWLVESLSATVLEDHPEIAELQRVDRKNWKQRLRQPSQWWSVLREISRQIAKLRSRRYDIVIDFQGNMRSAVATLLAGGRHRVAFHRRDNREVLAGLMPSRRVPRAPHRLNKVLKNLLVVRELGFQGEAPPGTIALRDADRAWAKSLLANLPESGPAVVIHPMVSRFGAFKRWPVENYRCLVDRLRELRARVVITWGPGERQIAESIDRPHVLDESIDLRRLAALVAEADLMVVADTGALPMATLLGTPTVGLFGPKDAKVYAPPGPVEVVTSPAPCSPCQLRRCEHAICMPLISASSVYDAAVRVLKRHGKNSS